ncbi:MAG: hypothetical protein LBT96_04550 [Campylobacteraceae bacterium]|jgi:hypothetical protein|nr:hypothetical protein [Campylobacteraceae bacterium]
MSKHTCGCDENAQENIGLKIVKHILCVKSNQGLVIWLTERLLPKLFWLSIVISIVLAFKLASITSNFSGVLDTIFTFIVALVVFWAFTFIGFYVIYILKTLKDNLVHENAEIDCGCGCESHKEESHKEETVVADASVTPAKTPLVKVKKKPGPKKGSKRVKKPKETTTE